MAGRAYLRLPPRELLDEEPEKPPLLRVLLPLLKLPLLDEREELLLTLLLDDELLLLLDDELLLDLTVLLLRVDEELELVEVEVVERPAPTLMVVPLRVVVLDEELLPVVGVSLAPLRLEDVLVPVVAFPRLEELLVPVEELPRRVVPLRLDLRS